MSPGLPDPAGRELRAASAVSVRRWQRPLPEWAQWGMREPDCADALQPLRSCIIKAADPTCGRFRPGKPSRLHAPILASLCRAHWPDGWTVSFAIAPHAPTTMVRLLEAIGSDAIGNVQGKLADQSGTRMAGPDPRRLGYSNNDTSYAVRV